MLNIDIGRYSSILKEIERNEASIFLIKGSVLNEG